MIELRYKKECCGCSACVQVCPKQCISLDEDHEGFLYPEIERELCIDCGLCEKVCPFLHPGEPREPLKTYAAKNKNDKIRLESSSGGIFTLLAEQILNKGGIVFGARFNEKWEVVHDYTDAIEGLFPFRGSKYVQSQIGNNYQKAEFFLKEGRKVLFSGTPCQIAGLKKYLRKEYSNLLAVNFICHGVPSPKVWRMYLDKVVSDWKLISTNKGMDSFPQSPDIKITDISFRDKTHGWQNFSLVIKGESFIRQKKHTFTFSEKFHDNIYMKGFLSDMYLRPSCYACKTKSGRDGADLTIADFWGAELVCNSFCDTKGVSLLAIFAPQERSFFNEDQLRYKEVPFADALKNNPSYETSPRIPKKRKSFFNYIHNDINVVNAIENNIGKLPFHMQLIGSLRRKAYGTFLHRILKTCVRKK